MKHVIKILGVLLVLLLLVFTIYSFLAGRDLPLQTYSDLEISRVVVPPEQNAYHHFVKAEGDYYGKENWQSGEARSAFESGTGPYSPEVEDYLNQYTEFVEIIEQGISTGNLQTPFPEKLTIIQPGSTVLLPYATIKCIEARRMAELGEVSASIDTLKMVFKLGKMNTREPVDATQLLVGNAILSKGLHQVWLLVESGEMREEDLAQLAELLPTDSMADEAFIFMIKAKFYTIRSVLIEAGEQHFTWNRLMKMTESEEAGWYGNIPFPPHLFLPNKSVDLFAFQTLEILKEFPENYEEYLSLQNNYSYRYKRGPIELFVKSNGIGRAFLWIFNPLKPTLFKGHFKFKTYLGATKIRIAAERYKLRNGRYPATLEQLLPDFLDSIPNDSMDGKPMRYDQERKLIYSIGFDMKDDGGLTEHRDAPGYKRLNAAWEMKDTIYYFQ